MGRRAPYINAELKAAAYVQQDRGNIMVQKAGRLAERLYRVLIPETKKAVALVEDWAALGTLAGSVRPQNQDRMLGGQFTSIDGKLFRMVALSDGMGGLKNGQEAAALTLSSLLWFLTSSNGPMDKRLVDAAHYANEQVAKTFNLASGATLSAVVVTSSGAIMALNVGDSRVYGYNQGRGLIQLSTDDTLAGLADQGINVDTRHNANALLQHIGMGESLEPHIFVMDNLYPYKSFVLTTDGIHWVGNRLLSLIADSAEDHVQLTRRLLSLAEMTGAHDNASIATMRPLPPLIASEASGSDIIDMELWTPQARTVLMSERRNPVLAVPSIFSDDDPPRSADNRPLQNDTPEIDKPRVQDGSTPRSAARPSSKRAAKGTKARIDKADLKQEPIDRPELFVEFETRRQGDD